MDQCSKLVNKTEFTGLDMFIFFKITKAKVLESILIHQICSYSAGAAVGASTVSAGVSAVSVVAGGGAASPPDSASMGSSSAAAGLDSERISK